MATYDLCVVGAGMIGSAAARHASSDRKLKVCLLGPEEPKEKRLETGNEVFGCYYDEARITRGAASYPIWGVLSQRSIKRYRELEELSGINFYHEVGSLVIGSKDGTFFDRVRQNAQDSGVWDKSSCISNSEMKNQYPYMTFGPDDVGICEKTESGYINPRKMVMAQITVASNQGCDVIRDVAVTIKHSKDHRSPHSIRTKNGHVIQAKKILLATNVFTGVYDLMDGVKPVFKPTPQTVTLARVNEKDAEKMRNMPAVLYSGNGDNTWYPKYPRNPDGNVHFYLLPPIKYPDGNFYLKLGHSDAILKHRLNIDEMRKWYCSHGDQDLENQMFQLLQSIFRGTNFISHHGDACVTMVTPTFHPYIDLISPTFGVALGGNGWAGKCSDEIGRVAAEMITESKWTYDIPHQHFELKTENPVSKL